MAKFPLKPNPTLPADATPERDAERRFRKDIHRQGTGANRLPKMTLAEIHHSERVHSPGKGDVQLPAGWARTGSKSSKR